MDQHQAGQEVALMEVRVEETPGAPRQPTASLCCFRCVLAMAAVLGLLLVGFTIYFFLFTPSCHQEASPAGRPGKVNITCTLTKKDLEGKYLIFTTRKAATYLIYGWVRVPSSTSREVILNQTWNGTSHPDKPTIVHDKDTLFFSKSVKSRTNIEISLSLSFQPTDSSIHVYEL